MNKINLKLEGGKSLLISSLTAISLLTWCWNSWDKKVNDLVVKILDTNNTKNNKINEDELLDELLWDEVEDNSNKYWKVENNESKEDVTLWDLLNGLWDEVNDSSNDYWKIEDNNLEENYNRKYEEYKEYLDIKLIKKYKNLIKNNNFILKRAKEHNLNKRKKILNLIDKQLLILKKSSISIEQKKREINTLIAFKEIILFYSK